MPFFFILPLWIMLLVLAVPLFFRRRLRFLGTHLVVASTLAVVTSFSLSTLALIAVPRLLPAFRFTGVVLLGVYLLSILLGGGAGLLVGVALAHKLNKRLTWWPVPRDVHP
jgi:hypothetical protein